MKKSVCMLKRNWSAAGNTAHVSLGNGSNILYGDSSFPRLAGLWAFYQTTADGVLVWPAPTDPNGTESDIFATYLPYWWEELGLPLTE